MKEVQFSIEINAGKQKIWDTLWQDETFRQWAGIIDPGTYLVGELKEGNEVQFLSASGYGVTSMIEKLTPGEFIRFRHQADTQNSGAEEREKEWTGGAESYTLTENDSTTTLTATFDVPPQQETYFTATYPKVLERIKTLTEKGE